MVHVKICGITNLEDARVAVECGANALGFNFYKRSPRYVEPERAREIVAALAGATLCVGVFVNEKTPQDVACIARETRVGAVQLHGDEGPEFCRALKKLTIIKALRVAADFKPESAVAYDVDAILLDAFSPDARGGTGHTFDWAEARRTRELVSKLYLAGGLTHDNVGAAIAAVRPFGVDVCSGVEREPGRKDPTVLKRFMEAVREVEDKP